MTKTTPTDVLTHQDSAAGGRIRLGDLELVRVGATIKQMREMRGMTQEQLSQAALLSRAYVANIEAGRKRASQKAVARIADALQVPQISIMLPSTPEQVAS